MTVPPAPRSRADHPEGAARAVDPSATWAVVTAYHPGPALVDVVADAARECAAVVVVDNTPAGSPGASALALHPSARVLALGENRGLAGGLDAGLGLVVAEGAAAPDAVLLLDQDSRVPAGMVAALAASLGPGVGAVGPAPWDAAHDRYLDPRARLRPELADVAVLITSGMLVRLEAVAAVLPLREDFFLDCVDQDFSLGMRDRGWRLLLDRRVRMPHTLGEVRRHGVGPLRVRATHHPTWRLYWVARNGVVLTREHWRTQPAWVAVNAALLLRWLLVIAAVEPPRRPRVGAFLAGLRDGLTGRRDARRLPPGARGAAAS